MTSIQRPVVETTADVPENWLNIAAQLPDRLPGLQRADGQPVTHAELAQLYSTECARIELLADHYSHDHTIPIPPPVRQEYRKYRPTPFCRAKGLEERLGFSGRIYFKREDCNPTGSHKPNTAIPQAYYASFQGLSELVTDTGAGQWGTALAWACHNMGLRCTVFMTRDSFLSKPYRRYMMELCGAKVIASPSNVTAHGRTLLEANASHCGSLGIGMGEAMEYLADRTEARLALGCMSYYAALHQTVIGQELVGQLGREAIVPDILIGCVGGGSNFVGFAAPFLVNVFTHPDLPRPQFVAVESANVPVLTQGRYEYEHADAFALTPRVKMYTLGRDFLPPEIHAGGLRYHGKTPILSLLVNKGLVSPAAISQEKAFHAGKLFFETEGILPAPESSHAIAQVLVEVEIAMHHGRTPTIVFCLSGHGYLDLEGYARALDLDSAPCRSDLEPVATDRLR